MTNSSQVFFNSDSGVSAYQGTGSHVLISGSASQGGLERVALFFKYILARLHLLCTRTESTTSLPGYAGQPANGASLEAAESGPSAVPVGKRAAPSRDDCGQLQHSRSAYRLL